MYAAIAKAKGQKLLGTFPRSIIDRESAASIRNMHSTLPWPACSYSTISRLAVFEFVSVSSKLYELYSPALSDWKMSITRSGLSNPALSSFMSVLNSLNDSKTEDFCVRKYIPMYFVFSMTNIATYLKFPSPVGVIGPVISDMTSVDSSFALCALWASVVLWGCRCDLAIEQCSQLPARCSVSWIMSACFTVMLVWELMDRIICALCAHAMRACSIS